MNNFPNNSLFFELVLCLLVFSSLWFVRYFSHLFGGIWNFFWVCLVCCWVGWFYICLLIVFTFLGMICGVGWFFFITSDGFLLSWLVFWMFADRFLHFWGWPMELVSFLCYKWCGIVWLWLLCFSCLYFWDRLFPFFVGVLTLAFEKYD